MMGNESLTFEVGENDDFCDGPWSAASTSSGNAILFGSNF